MKYSFIGKAGSSRLLLVCEVALGEIFATTKIDTKLTAPPTGYQSVQGVRPGETTQHSDFEVQEIHTLYWKLLREFNFCWVRDLPEIAKNRHSKKKPYHTSSESVLEIAKIGLSEKLTHLQSVIFAKISRREKFRIYGMLIIGLYVACAWETEW